VNATIENLKLSAVYSSQQQLAWTDGSNSSSTLPQVKVFRFERIGPWTRMDGETGEISQSKDARISDAILGCLEFWRRKGADNA